ncbi:uncharacterized protein KIAA0040 homolog [Gadus chalcogrammus]|uniref:uncharacterized protein KIAA0040 homolog n=1 Tax=Gadus chalcogrammus TaxID=1042646 RepID=UPI0024C490B8|nr:uncharacterized protein KIAA0040 homolog [Gadus chalcogrammus]
MADKKGTVLDFFNQLWNFAADKHNQGVYNTVCLAVLLALPLLVLLTSLVVCCHYCCGGSGCCCCRRRRDKGAAVTARSDTKKKKKQNRGDTEDLWISVKTGQMTPDRIAMEMV